MCVLRGVCVCVCSMVFLCVTSPPACVFNGVCVLSGVFDGVFCVSHHYRHSHTRTRFINKNFLKHQSARRIKGQKVQNLHIVFSSLAFSNSNIGPAGIDSESGSIVLGGWEAVSSVRPETATFDLNLSSYCGKIHLREDAETANLRAMRLLRHHTLQRSRRPESRRPLTIQKLVTSSSIWSRTQRSS